MVRPTAIRYIAPMQNMSTLRDFSSKDTPRNPMGKRFPTVKRKASVVQAPSLPGSPQPTTAMVKMNLPKKPLNHSFGSDFTVFSHLEHLSALDGGGRIVRAIRYPEEYQL